MDGTILPPSYFTFYSIKDELERDPGRYLHNKWRYKIDLFREFLNIFGEFPENSSFESVSSILAAYHELTSQAYPTVPPPGHPELAHDVFPLWKALPGNEAPLPQPSGAPGRRITQHPSTTTSVTPKTRRPPKAKRTNTGDTRTARAVPTELMTGLLPPASPQLTNGDDLEEVIFLKEIISLKDHLPQGRPRDGENTPMNLSNPPPDKDAPIPRRTWSKGIIKSRKTCNQLLKTRQMEEVIFLKEVITLKDNTASLEDDTLGGNFQDPEATPLPNQPTLPSRSPPGTFLRLSRAKEESREKRHPLRSTWPLS